MGLTKNIGIAAIIVIGAIAAVYLMYTKNTANEASVFAPELEAAVFESVEAKTEGVWDKRIVLGQVDDSTNAAVGTWYANDAWHWIAWRGSNEKWQTLVSLDGFDCAELKAVPEEYSSFFYDTTHSPEGKLYCYEHSTR